jgi:hypothetical protein
MLPTKKYSELYNNEKYDNLSKAIADHMGILEYCPTQEFLDIMVEIQDKAIAYSNLVYFNSSDMCRIVTNNENVRPFYLAFLQPYLSHYNQGRY